MTLDSYINDKENQLPSGYIWKKDKFAGYDIVYPVDIKTGNYAFLHNEFKYPAVLYNGKIYQAYGTIPGNFIQYDNSTPNEALDMDGTLFNKTAAQFFADIYNTSTSF